MTISRRHAIGILGAAGAGAFVLNNISRSAAAPSTYGPCLTPQPKPTDQGIELSQSVGSSQEPELNQHVGTATDEPVLRLHQMVAQTKAWTKDHLQKNGGKLILPYAFLDGVPKQHDWVNSFASGWLVAAGASTIALKLETDPTKALIRIKFTRDASGSGSWSKVGNDAWDLRRRSNIATMMIEDMVPTMSDKLAQFYVLHEFGHALGLLHEHAYPGAVQWNKQVVLDYYKTHYAWDEAKVTANVFNVYTDGFVCSGLNFDPASVMQYPIKEGHATIKNRPDIKEIGYNSTLTAGDLKCAHAVYG